MNTALQTVTLIEGEPVVLNNVQRSFGSVQVLKGIDLDIRAGEFVALVGRSGCGKSTLLRLLAGLDEPDEGSIFLGQSPLTAKGNKVRLMFQDDRLLPWKTVVDNVGLGLKGDWRKQAIQALEEVGLADKAGVWPAQLSGGQRQRVALARALIHRPRLLLLDEPLGALDALTRLEMQQLIERLWLQHRFTVVLVTHDVPEAVQLADRVIVLEDGKIGMTQAVSLTRPRDATSLETVALASKVLGRVLQQPARETETAQRQFSDIRWAW